MPEVLIGLGSNLGDRARNLADAVRALAAHVDDVRVSSIWQTEPVGLREQPTFYNAAIAGRTALDARALLDAMTVIERGMGRKRAVPLGPRIIDLDLLTYGDREIDQPGLTVPHPRMSTRRFVLAPLAEIAPDTHVGRAGPTVAALLARLPVGESVERIDVPGWPPSNLSHPDM